MWVPAIIILFAIIGSFYYYFAAPKIVVSYSLCILNSADLLASPSMRGHRAEEKTKSLEVFANDNRQETD